MSRRAQQQQTSRITPSSSNRLISLETLPHNGPRVGRRLALSGFAFADCVIRKVAVDPLVAGDTPMLHCVSLFSECVGADPLAG
ncbi:hypothetical protein PISL3812_02291 [Talaromyces islandicus]|uniref:Uncharacterized protein n=1 Tax=Talaromyces islandicus TaxID=28573 RepID=A0A0U1LPH8_TALIS|nr:hypothetical protein PISL3812_02291 [Talaromyces islandicus]